MIRKKSATHKASAYKRIGITPDINECSNLQFFYLHGQLVSHEFISDNTKKLLNLPNDIIDIVSSFVNPVSHKSYQKLAVGDIAEYLANYGDVTNDLQRDCNCCKCLIHRYFECDYSYAICPKCNTVCKRRKWLMCKIVEINSCYIYIIRNRGNRKWDRHDGFNRPIKLKKNSGRIAPLGTFLARSAKVS